MHRPHSLLGLALVAAAPFTPAALAQTIDDAPQWLLSSPSPDLVVGEQVATPETSTATAIATSAVTGRVFGSPVVAILPGGPDGPGYAPMWLTFDVMAVHAFNGVGDVNGDGFDDFGLGEPEYDAPGDPNTGRVRVFHGGPSGTERQRGLVDDFGLLEQRDRRRPVHRWRRERRRYR